MKKTENTKTQNTTNNAVLTDVNAVLEALTLDTKKFEVIRCYDNEEFNEVQTIRKSYANIRETDTKRSVIKLWGHKTFVTVEASKMLRKKEQINIDKKIYKEKTLDKNNNYVCDSVKDATALTKDFLQQVEKMNTATATEKTNESEASA